jgi:hypothetical protein
MRKRLLALAAVQSAFAVIPYLAMAQEETNKKKDVVQTPPHTTPPPANQKNRINVLVDETIPEFQIPSDTRQKWPAYFENEGTSLWFDHNRHFRRRPSLTSPLSPPLEMTLTGGMHTFTVTTDFGKVTEILTGNARNDPVVTKPGLFGSSDDDTEDDSDQVPLVGPQFAYPVKDDMSDWEATSWLPQGTLLLVYARALFGSFEVFDEDASLQLYSLGLEVRVPLYADDTFRVGFALGAGPAYLHTGIGDALGFELGAGLRFELPISGGLSFLTNLDVSLYAAEDVTSWGPGLSFGLALSW